ncbi:HAD hydrolase family protein [uncultured Clostridium sp.]|uniref:HAD hydrolase family protein n=1 Tax=uncultured Clostridium sp. TaxID=59620 RepID=UPI0025EB02E0|nr:HAD hydrolase family protein [uncultured Clostridium sp.]
MKDRLSNLPPIGMRIIKSAIGVFLGFVIYFIRGKQGTPFYTALSVLWCMQPYTSDSKNKSLQRTIGTLIGAVYGLLFIMFEYYVLEFRHEFLRYAIISLLIIAVIYTTVLLNKKNSSYFSCVVYLSIVVLHITDENPYLFVLNRVLDTMIGIAIAFGVNNFKIPTKKNKDILFVSELDDVLLTMRENLTSYSRFQLNKMLDDGAKFTIATMRSPASLLEALQGININLPVVVMDGAMLFDIKNNRCLKLYKMTVEETNEFIEFFHKRNYHCFVNVVIEDSVVIYYGDFKNKIEETIYNELRVSPYRNYIKGNFPLNTESAYLMLIDTEERIEKLYLDLVQAGYTKSYKILKYLSHDYKGYMYIKIYNKQAVKKNMIMEIKKMAEADKIITFGNLEGVSDIIINGRDGNEIVKKFQKTYEPYFWTK